MNPAARRLPAYAVVLACSLLRFERLASVLPPSVYSELRYAAVICAARSALRCS